MKNPEKYCFQKLQGLNIVRKKCLQEDATGKKMFAQTTTRKKLFVFEKFPSTLQKIMVLP